MINIDGIKFSLSNLIFKDLEKFGINLKKVSVAGGYIRAKLNNEDVKDIDLFIEDEETANKVRDFFNKKAKAGKIVKDKLYNYTYKNKWFQLIYDKKYDMSKTDLIDSFDYTICCGMIRGDGEFKCCDTYYQDLLSKHLRINKITFPISTLQRMQKYIIRGYKACNGTLLSVSKAISKLNEEDIKNQIGFYSDGSAKFIGVD